MAPGDDADRVIGRRIYAARKRKGLSQSELSARLGLKPWTVGRIERGRRSLSAPLLLRIAQLLDVSPAHLLTGERDVAAQTDAERALIADFRRLKPDRQTSVSRFFRSLAVTQERAPC